MRLFPINSLAIGLHIVPWLCAVRLSDGCLSRLWVSSCIAGQDLITEHDVIQGSDIPRIQAKYVHLLSCIHSDTNIAGTSIELVYFCLYLTHIIAFIGCSHILISHSFRVQDHP